MDFARVLELLSDAEIDFVLVGGIAATIHGSTRLTRHVDIVYSRRPENIERLVGALTPLRPYLRGAPRGLPFELSVDTVTRGLNFALTTDIGDIDLLGALVDGSRYEELLGRSECVPLYGSGCWCANLVELIRLKRASGQPKDLVVAAELEAVWEERHRMLVR
jgi:hypothetical protein